MDKMGWLYRQLKWIEENSKNWPIWMKKEVVLDINKKRKIKKSKT